MEMTAFENDCNKTLALAESLYEALANGDSTAVASLVAPDLEWWFHGPPHRHHMMRTLTGEATHDEFRFMPRGVTAIGDRVVAEGWEDGAYWVHVWTVEGAVVTQFREYFNTTLTVRRFVPTDGAATAAVPRRLRRSEECPALWQSMASAHLRRNLPGLVLAL